MICCSMKNDARVSRYPETKVILSTSTMMRSDGSVEAT